MFSFLQVPFPGPDRSGHGCARGPIPIPIPPPWSRPGRSTPDPDPDSDSDSDSDPADPADGGPIPMGGQVENIESQEN